MYHILKYILEPDPWGQPRPLGLGPARAHGCIPCINMKILKGFGAQKVPYFEDYSGARPVGMGYGVGANHGPRVHPSNRPENMTLFEVQSVPYFEVYSRARPVGLGSAMALVVGASQGPRVHPRRQPKMWRVLELTV